MRENIEGRSWDNFVFSERGLAPFKISDVTSLSSDRLEVLQYAL